jgi:3-methyl-2-oxobutanoate hydroxymethyltransferase
LSTLPQDAAPAAPSERHKVTVRTIQARRDKGEPITMLTAYDFPSARLVDEAGVDMILVGDSLAMVVLGHENTLSVTLDEMLHHARAVRRGARFALLVGDLPFMTYQVGEEQALRSAGRYVQEAGMDAVKIEGGRIMAATARRIVGAGIPVQGHIGLTPQSVNTLGGWRVQGKTARAALDLMDDALALEDAGVFSIVLESVPEPVAQAITDRLRIPTIGIGAGLGASGQVLVYHDLLGLHAGLSPRFVRRYAELGQATRQAVAAYAEEVKARRFPAPEHTYPMPEEELAAFRELLAEREQRRPAPEGGRRLLA